MSGRTAPAGGEMKQTERIQAGPGPGRGPFGGGMVGQKALEFGPSAKRLLRRMAPERHKALVDRTPIGRLVTMAEVASAARFLLENEAVNGLNLVVDGGWMCM